MIGLKISELPSVADLRESDQLLMVRGKGTKRLPGSVFLNSREQISKYLSDFNDFSNHTINVVDSATITLQYDTESRTLSAEFAGSELLSPQTPFVYSRSITAYDSMHNKTIIIDSPNDETICLPALAESGVKILFIRAGDGEVTFTSSFPANINTAPDASYVKFAYKNSCVTAYHLNDNQWFLNGDLTSDYGGYILLDGKHGPLPTPTPTRIPITPSITPSVTPSITPSISPSPMPEVTPSITPSSSAPVVLPTCVKSSYIIVEDLDDNFVINGIVGSCITLHRGRAYTFENKTPEHRFWIKTAPSTGMNNIYTAEGLVNNGTDGKGLNRFITFNVPCDAPEKLYYHNDLHEDMGGVIYIIGDCSDPEPSPEPEITPSTSGPSVTPSVTPSTSGPSVTPSVTPSTSGPSVTPSVTPSTSI